MGHGASPLGHYHLVEIVAIFMGFRRESVGYMVVRDCFDPSNFCSWKGLLIFLVLVGKLGIDGWCWRVNYLVRDSLKKNYRGDFSSERKCSGCRFILLFISLTGFQHVNKSDYFANRIHWNKIRLYIWLPEGNVMVVDILLTTIDCKVSFFLYFIDCAVQIFYGLNFNQSTNPINPYSIANVSLEKIFTDSIFQLYLCFCIDF